LDSEGERKPIMNFEQLQELFTTDKELAEKVKLSFFTPDSINNFLETEEGKKIVQPKMDKYFSKGLDTWKNNNLQKLIDEAVANANPQETPEQKAIRELQEKLNKVENEKHMEALKLKAHAEANTLGVPAELVNYFVADTEEGTKENLKAFDLQYKSAIEKAVEEKLKQSAQTPPAPPSKQNGTGDISKEDFMTMKYQERLKLFNENPELYKTLAE